MIHFSIIVAVDQNYGIGINGQLPWHLPADLKHFKEITCQTSSPSKQNVVIMGRKTWESLPEKFRPLPNRINIVLSRNKDLLLPPNVFKFESLQKTLQSLELRNLRGIPEFENVYVIGGEQIFNEAIKFPECQKLYVTHIQQSFDCDTFFPPFATAFIKQSSSAIAQQGGISFSFTQYVRKSS